MSSVSDDVSMMQRTPIRVDQVWGLEAHSSDKKWEILGRYMSFNLFNPEFQTLRKCEAYLRGDGFVFAPTLYCGLPSTVNVFRSIYHRPWNVQGQHVLSNLVDNTATIPEGFVNGKFDEIPVCVLLADGKIQGTDSSKRVYWHHPMTIVSMLDK